VLEISNGNNKILFRSRLPILALTSPRNSYIIYHIARLAREIEKQRFKAMKTISTFEAKNKLSEVIASAERGEPQVITKNGRKSAVVISFQEFERLTAKKIPLVEFLLDNPSRTDAVEIDLTRDKSFPTDEIDFNGEDFV
jgi:prevent-host-death family protein